MVQGESTEIAVYVNRRGVANGAAGTGCEFEICASVVSHAAGIVGSSVVAVGVDDGTGVSVACGKWGVLRCAVARWVWVGEGFGWTLACGEADGLGGGSVGDETPQPTKIAR
jgi:hypothetical protein